MVLPIGLGLLLLQALSELIKRIAFVTGHGPNPLVRRGAAGATADDFVAAIKTQGKSQGVGEGGGAAR